MYNATKKAVYTLFQFFLNKNKNKTHKNIILLQEKKISLQWSIANVVLPLRLC